MDIEKIIESINDQISNKGLKLFNENYRDFDWGIVFEYQSKEFIVTRELNELLIGTGVILYDKHEESIKFICGKFIDRELEKYRIKKGYPHVIKFPPSENINKLSDLDKVFVLMKTEEEYQIQQALNIIEERKLFEIDRFVQVLKGNKVNDLIEDIALCINSNTIFYYESQVNSIDIEITLMKKHIKELNIWNCNICELPEFITELEELEKIYIYNTPIYKIPIDYRNLKKLKEIHLERTLIPNNKIYEINLNKGCEIIIEDSMKKKFNPIQK